VQAGVCTHCTVLFPWINSIALVSSINSHRKKRGRKKLDAIWSTILFPTRVSPTIEYFFDYVFFYMNVSGQTLENPDKSARLQATINIRRSHCKLVWDANILNNCEGRRLDPFAGHEYKIFSSAVVKDTVDILGAAQSKTLLVLSRPYGTAVLSYVR